jgi:AmmeMemoRadiSam system protein B
MGFEAEHVKDAPTAIQRPTHPLLFFDEATFYRAVQTAEAAPGPGMEGPVLGGIIPHHWLPGHLITGFFRGLAAGDRPDTVVILGPNHTNTGSARVLSSDLAWETPFGLVQPDQFLVRALAERGLVKLEPSSLTTEHSVAGIIPAVKYYLPEARVVPVILNSDLTPAEARRLGEALAGLWSDDLVIVAAVDFSHYLVRAEAEGHDAVTLSLLEAFDADTLFTLDNAYLDSPPSIAVLLAAMKQLEAEHFVLVENTNSGRLEGDELVPTTSYIVGYYRPTALPSSASADTPQ